jgi:short-subunit dehydrogenase
MLPISNLRAMLEHGPTTYSLSADQLAASPMGTLTMGKGIVSLSNSDAQVVIITGGSSGIGRCTAALFARRGWKVGLIARGEEGLAASRRDIEALGGVAVFAQADVANSKSLTEAANAIVIALGPMDVWINCAGNGVYGRFTDVPEREFGRVTDVTYHGAVNGTRIALAAMRSRDAGSIVNVCSAIAFHGLPLMSSYAGAKAAVRAFGQAVQGELRLERSRIKISTVFPPAVNTPFFSHAVSHMGWPARPARPVYQPEVIAQGIWQAVESGRSEMTISGTAATFALATRIAPSLIAWCMSRFGIERQLTRDIEACRLQEPTLFAPARRVFDVRGPFNKGARARSMHLLLEQQLMDLKKLFKSAWAVRALPSSARLQPTHVRPTHDQEPGGSAGPLVGS